MTTKKPSEIRPDRKGWFKPYIAGTWQLYLMMLIPIIYIICFKYKPMLGIVMAFKKYTPFGGRSMWEMEWVGFQWFQEAFRDSLFWKSLGNTLVLNLGDLVFVNLPEVGDTVTAGEPFGDVESVKAVSDLLSPVSGTVCEINEELLDAPEKINEDPYGAWMIKVEGAEEGEDLMDAAAYEEHCAAEA